MGNQNWNQIGSDLRDAVQQSIKTGDFRELGDVVTNTLGDVIFGNNSNRDYVDSHFTDQRSSNINYHSSQGVGANYSSNSSYGNSSSNGYSKEYHINSNNNRFQPPRVKMQRKGEVSGILYTVFGGIGTGIAGAGLVVFALLGLVLLSPVVNIIGSSIIGLLLLGFIGMIGKGNSNRKLLKRADRYLSLCNGQTYVNIETLSQLSGKSEEYVRKDVKKMLEKGIFPEGHLDTKETCLILNDSTYREYLDLEKQRRALEMEQFADRQRNKYTQTPVENETKFVQPDNPELDQLMAEGNGCIERLRKMNDNIAGEVISEKLFRLEKILKEIFDRVKEKPEQMPKMKKFMDYYLPTTLKLVEKYAEFDDISTPGDDVIQAKVEIEKTIDTINSSFEELLNNLYIDDVYDVTTDAKVLKTMLEKEGLSKNDPFAK